MWKPTFDDGAKLAADQAALGTGHCKYLRTIVVFHE
jgi:hypothetical protein